MLHEAGSVPVMLSESISLHMQIALVGMPGVLFATTVAGWHGLLTGM